MTGVRRAALVLTSDDGHALDLRSVAGALSGRADVTDWRIVVGRRERDRRGQVVVHVLASGDPAAAAVAAAAEIRAMAGTLPTQVVAADGALADVGGEPMTGRILVRP